MKKTLLIISSVAAIFLMAACEEKANPIWGLWLQKPVFGPKTEIMFNDDNTGFVFVADTVKYETTWSEDSLLRVFYREASSQQNSLGDVKSYKVKIDGDVMLLEEKKTGDVTKYSRYVE